MNILHKLWAVLTKGARQRSEVAERLERISQLEVRHRALIEASCDARQERLSVSQGLKQPNQSSKVRYLNNKIKEYRTEQLQIEALLRDMK